MEPGPKTFLTVSSISISLLVIVYHKSLSYYLYYTFLVSRGCNCDYLIFASYRTFCVSFAGLCLSWCIKRLLLLPGLFLLPLMIHTNTILIWGCTFPEDRVATPPIFHFFIKEWWGCKNMSCVSRCTDLYPVWFCR